MCVVKKQREKRKASYVLNPLMKPITKYQNFILQRLLRWCCRFDNECSEQTLTTYTFNVSVICVCSWKLNLEKKCILSRKLDIFLYWIFPIAIGLNVSYEYLDFGNFGECCVKYVEKSSLERERELSLVSSSFGDFHESVFYQTKTFLD